MKFTPKKCFCVFVVVLPSRKVWKSHAFMKNQPQWENLAFTNLLEILAYWKSV